jgi:hypothetical protein
MKIGDIYETYLRAADLQKPVQVQISEVTIRTFKDQGTGDTRRKVVLAFFGARKTMVLNKTQARAVAAAVGTDEIEQWLSRSLVLSPGKAVNGQPTILVGPVVTAPAAGGNPFGTGGTVPPVPAAAGGGDDGKDKAG